MSVLRMFVLYSLRGMVSNRFTVKQKLDNLESSCILFYFYVYIFKYENMVIQLHSSKKYCHNRLTSHKPNTCSYVTVKQKLENLESPCILFYFYVYIFKYENMVIKLRSSKKYCHNQLTSHNSNTCSYVIHRNAFDSSLVSSSVTLQYVKHFWATKRTI
jgi:DNA polymerase sigma